MRRTMFRRFGWLFAITACGGSPGPRAPHAGGSDEPRLEPKVDQTWYRTTSICGQGPFEVELPTTGAKWGEEVELLVHAPRAIALHAEVIADGRSVAAQAYGDRPANSRCVADAKERLALAHAGGGGGGTGVPVETGTLVVPPPSAAAPPTLSIVTENVTTSEEIVRFRLPALAAPHITIRFWSVEPNDLEGVVFGAAHVVWQPTVPEAQYEAYLQQVAERERAQADAYLRAHPVHETPAAPEDPAARERRLREEERRAREDEDRRRRQHERDLEDERRRQIEAALELQRREQRAKFCAAHPGDRDCWGAGGLRVHLDLQLHQREAAEYCQAHQEDVRCWSDEERARRTDAWRKRLADAAAVSTCQPTGAPPSPQSEVQPPALSTHATWRPGYYQWSECTWVWLAGQWRVPDEDIAANETTQAPAAPPPLQVEAPPPPPVHAAMWVPGFWQWSVTTGAWVWIVGSWQLPPSATVTWRPAEWRPRGTVHVLVPGGWIHVR